MIFRCSPSLPQEDMNEQGNCAPVVNTGEEISHPLRALTGPDGAHQEGLELERSLFRSKSFCMVFIFGYINQALCDFQLIFTTKSPQLNASWTWARGILSFLKISIFFSVYVFVVYRKSIRFAAKPPCELGVGLYNAFLI